MKRMLMALMLMPLMALAGSDLYMVIDLSDGTSASSYPISYLSDVPSGGWTDEYKTTKLVLRRIEPGTCVVTTDKPYYIGVFEVTQKQYELITGTTPSYFSGNDMRPVEQVSYDMLRGTNKGAQYPDSTDIDDDSVMAILRNHTGLHFDLPTKEQWEYACRAGATTMYCYGDSADGDYMWYWSYDGGNSDSRTHDVGTRKPNNWGLYDMHGNVWEWCLEWRSDYLGEQRIIRGGSWGSPVSHCTSSFQYEDRPSYEGDDDGFRLVVNTGTLFMDGYTFTTGGDAEWYVDTTVSYDGVSSLRSGDIGHNDWTWLELEINEAVDIVLSFRWKVSSEGMCDPLVWYVDGVEQAIIGGEYGGWGLQTVVLSSGVHTITWEYSKDSDETEGSDCGWVDTLTIREYTPTEPVTYYVNGATGSDGNSGLYSSSAKLTIQAAIDASNDGDTILVAAGTYAPISTWNKAIVIRGIEGASKTFIDGGNVATCARLCGNGDSNVKADCHRTTLEGFTLLNGSADKYTEGVCAAAYRGTLKKCIVRNCRNASICRGCIMSDTLAYSNCCERTFSESEVYNCTVVDNQGCGLHNCTAWNTISWNNSSDVSSGTLSYCLTKESIKGGVGNITGTPKFVDADKNDYRIRSWFPGVDAGDNARVTNATDLAGNARIAYDFVDIGCYESSSRDILYVDQETGADSNSGRTKLAPKATIQAAIDVANDGDTILVADGTYDAISVGSWRGITIRSMNGAATTFIDGKNSTTVANLSNGDAKGTNFNHLIGFTLQNGYASKQYGCGAFGGGLAVNCVLRNNYAAGYGSGVVYGGDILNCIVYGNTFGSGAGGIACNSKLYNCTVCNNSAGFGLWDCEVYNSISYNSGSEYRSFGFDNTYHNSLTKRGLDPELGNITEDPQFKDATNGDFHLVWTSPCVDQGCMDCYTTWQKDRGYAIPSEYFATDFYGNQRVSGTQVDMGAIEKIFLEGGGPYTEVVDGIEWTFYVRNGIVSIGNGSSAAIPTSTAGRVVVPEKLDGCFVVNINSYAFSYCGGITSVVFPSSVTNVYKRVFNYCGSLGDVEFPASLEYLDNATFRYAANVTNITFYGNAPESDDDSFKYPSPNFTVTVNWGTAGWDDDGDGYWMGRKLIYLNYPYYHVLLNPMGGVCANNKLYVIKNAQIGEVDDATRTGYLFNGWFSASEGGDRILPSTIATEDVTLYAHWTPINYSIRFNANGGSGTMGDQSFAYDESQLVSSNAFTRTGYSFAGWTCGTTTFSNCQSVNNLSVEDGAIVELVAQWNPIEYSVRFDAGGGEGEMPDQAYVYDVPQNLTATAFTRIGYEFAGWKYGALTLVDGQNVSNLTNETGAVVLLTAQWNPIDYAITYQDTHGCANENPTTYTVEDALTFCALTNSPGWKFDGWSPVGIEIGSTGPVTVTAIWEKVDIGVEAVLGGNWKNGTTAQGAGMVFSTADETADGGLSVRLMSEDDCSTWIETKVTGEMWVSFDWKTSCETYSDLELDRIEFLIDGHRQAWANGETDWTNLTFAVRGTGEHTLCWAYVKDESDYMGEDCAWVANVTKTPKTAVATPVIDLASTYNTETTTCTIMTETEGATILYKFDFYGDDSGWYEYQGPFGVTGTTKVVAYAIKRDYYDSETVSAECERTLPWTLGECVNAANLDFVTGGDSDWLRTTTTAHDGVAAIRSGVIGDSKQSWVKVQMLGPGTLSFWWKTDSEYYKKNLLDYATFKVDGKEISKIGGSADWTQVSHAVTGTGLHTYLWTYAKNAQTAMGEDCVWLDEISWTPDTTGGITISEDISGGNEFVIDTDWKESELDEKFGSGRRDIFHKRYGNDLSAALLKKSGKRDTHGNPRYVWQDYVMGTDPTDKTSEFITSVEMVDGLPIITWKPDLNEGGAKSERAYKIWGSTNLVNGGDWEWPTNALHRFFKVTVEMK